MRVSSFAVFASAVCCASLAFGQAASAIVPPVVSPQVNADHTVTFHYLAPAAGAVALAVEGTKDPVPMRKGADGVWSVTTAAMQPEYYYYSFEVDGRKALDPHNFQIASASNAVSNSFLIAGGKPWEPAAIPHGVISRHPYTTHVVLGRPANQSEYVVYTPPGFDPRGTTKYPVLYLLHGWSQNAEDWTGFGHAGDVLDSLIAAGKAKPMIVVMPTGYGDMSFLDSFAVWQESALIDHNVGLFEKALLTEVMPAAEREYPISAKAEDRAIAGLSMGGLEALEAGIGHPELFAYVGGFSAAVHKIGPGAMPAGFAKSNGTKLVWIACGTEDNLIEANRRLAATLKQEGFPVTEVETPGLHTWTVWRDNLVHFAPLLFQK